MKHSSEIQSEEPQIGLSCLTDLREKINVRNNMCVPIMTQFVFELTFLSFSLKLKCAIIFLFYIKELSEKTSFLKDTFMLSFLFFPDLFFLFNNSSNNCLN